MVLPDASIVQKEAEDRCTQAKADIAWLASYLASAKVFQKSAENGAALAIPLPDAIMRDPNTSLHPQDPIKGPFTRLFHTYRDIDPSHGFGHYLNLSAIIATVAVLEEVVEDLYAIRTGGATLKKVGDRSRGLRAYVKILSGGNGGSLIPHPDHIVVDHIIEISHDVRRLARLRNKAIHTYRHADFDANVATVVIPHLAHAVRFIDKLQDKILKHAKPRPRSSTIRLTLRRLWRKLAAKLGSR
jgi:uncharacterized protein YlaI